MMNELEALRELHNQVRRMRMTAPVDDDFGEVMDDMCRAHNRATELLDTDYPGGFVVNFNRVADEVNQTAVEKGWWTDDRNEGEMIALMHSELSEALEALRHGNPPDSHIPEFNGVEAEMADVIIRIMDYAKAKNYCVAEALVAKINFNKTRPHMHGGKEF